MLTPYRVILSLPGALAFCSFGLVARLSASMMGLSLLLLLSDERGSYAVAGQVTGAYVLFASVVGPLQARVVDRYGQRATLLPLAFVNMVAKCAIVLTVALGFASPVPQICAAIGGTTSPLVGTYVRARWSTLLKDRSQLRTAYALESLLEDVCSVIGPPLATLLASNFSPIVGLAVAIGCSYVGTTLFALQSRTEPAVSERVERNSARERVRWLSLSTVCLTTAGLGTLSGSINVAVVAFCSEEKVRGLTGLLLGAMAVASILAALAVGVAKFKLSPQRQVQVAALAAALLLAPLPLSDGIVLMSVIMTLVAFALSPAMIASFSAVEQVVPASRLSEGIAWTTSSMLGGYSLGAAVAGSVVDSHHAAAAFYVPLAAALMTFCFALLIPRETPASATEKQSSLH